MRKNICNFQENGVRTRCAAIVNHSAIVNLLRVVNLLCVVFLVRRGPLGKQLIQDKTHEFLTHGKVGQNDIYCPHRYDYNLNSDRLKIFQNEFLLEFQDVIVIRGAFPRNCYISREFFRIGIKKCNCNCNLKKINSRKQQCNCNCKKIDSRKQKSCM